MTWQLLLFSRSVMSNSATPWIVACQASLSFTSSLSLLKLMFIELMMPSNPLTLCRPLLLLAISCTEGWFSQACPLIVPVWARLMLSLSCSHHEEIAILDQ